MIVAISLAVVHQSCARHQSTGAPSGGCRRWAWADRGRSLHQNLSDTPDPSVAGRSSGAVRLTASGSPPSPPRSYGSRTSIDLVAVDQSGAAASRVAVEIMRILRDDASTFLTDGSTAILGHVEAEWGGPAGSTTRGCIALVR